MSEHGTGPGAGQRRPGGLAPGRRPSSSRPPPRRPPPRPRPSRPTAASLRPAGPRSRRRRHADARPTTRATAATRCPPPGAGAGQRRARAAPDGCGSAIAGLVAGALIGGGAGAGVAGPARRPARPRRAPAPRRRASTIKNPETATTATAAAAKAAPSVVTIYVSSGSNSGSGSGVVLTDDGYVLTNNHVVTLEGAGTGTVQVRTADGTLYDAKVVGTDPSSDLAVVKLDGASGLTPATFADSDKVQVGDVAVAIGAPLGLSNTVTDGIVSATGRAVATGSTQNDATVIDAHPDRRGDQPGQLRRRAGQRRRRGHRHQHRDRDRRLRRARVGSRRAATSASASPSRPTPPSGSPRSSSRTARPPAPFLGVSARTAADDAELRRRAPAPRSSRSSRAAPRPKAGLKAGDVITAVGDRPVTTSTELTAAVRSKAPGDKVTLTVRRGERHARPSRSRWAPDRLDPLQDPRASSRRCRAGAS